MALNAKQERFVQEYLVDLNATQAATRAGYSEKTAYSQGQRLLKNVEVAAAIAKAQEKRAEKVEITQEMVLAELAKIGFSDLRNALTPTGNLLDPAAWDDSTAGAISSVEVTEIAAGFVDEDEFEYVKKIRTWDKLSALEKIGKHLGMFNGAASDDDEAKPMTFNINVNAPKGDVRVTKPE